jgi:acetyltransferase
MMKQSPKLRAIELDTRSIELKDGTTVLLRPLRREDEPKLYDLYTNCSRETLFRRYHHAFKMTHEHIRDLCSIDDDREISIVAELDTHELVGHCRLVFSYEKDSAEYAILITDVWQGRGLGRRMTTHCLELAEACGTKRISAVTTPDNVGMIEVFRKTGFSLDYDRANGEIQVQRTFLPPNPATTFLKRSA